MSVVKYVEGVLSVIVNQKVHYVQSHPEHGQNHLIKGGDTKSLTVKDNRIHKTSNKRHPPIPNENHLNNDIRLNRWLRHITDWTWGLRREGVQCQCKKAESCLA